MHSITATELAKSLSETINSVKASGQSLLITRGGKPVAILSPPPKQGLTVDELVEVLSNMPRLGDDAASFAEDVRLARSNDSNHFQP
ncbi:type II toxin-antitoxin system Phd/YefM family antitoxin [Endozoicomonas sp. 4G]|uniref:type II toxin-antitoxin system Phd/YefM family antitoxin n=1 Tax=Endozoicomonas sp. 4G TaxID=2872754 RepID=UPI002078A4E7|nr:type II toxin-antitoxin system Phd/YefM family antitoxin [Endozoicomonas sp. 4G]